MQVAVESVAPSLEPAIDAAAAFVYSSTTLATAGEREVTLRARELALERDVRVCFDPNIRPNRWGGDERAAAAASRAVIEGSFLVRASHREATAITGLDDPREAAAAIAAIGAELAVVTLGAEGAVVRGACGGGGAGARGERRLDSRCGRRLHGHVRRRARGAGVGPGERGSGAPARARRGGGGLHAAQCARLMVAIILRQ